MTYIAGHKSDMSGVITGNAVSITSNAVSLPVMQ